MYYGAFSSAHDVEKEFQIELKKENILFATYDMGDYEGSALVIFEENSKLYEVSASHCSCYGLEDQWSAEETFLEAILMRVKKNEYYGISVENMIDVLTDLELVINAKSKGELALFLVHDNAGLRSLAQTRYNEVA